MSPEEIQTHAQNLYAPYCLLILENGGYVHDPEAHNLCSAIFESEGRKWEFLSYSNVSGLPARVRTFVQGSLIPATPVENPLIKRGGMQDLHTEVRLINYLHSIGMFSRTGVLYFFSTRSVCKTCAKAISAAQQQHARTVAFVPLELKAESGLDSIEKVHMYLATKGTMGATRDTTSEQGAMDLGM